MSRVRRVSANVPSDLLTAALQVTGKGITDTLIEGLERIARRRAYGKVMALRGKVSLSIDVDELRGRHR